jgi:DNA-binding CsgD family transcriptional regulator
MRSYTCGSMPRFRAGDRAAITDIQRSLSVYVDGGPSGVAATVQPLRELLSFDLAVGYGVGESDESFHLSFAEADGGCGPTVVRRALGQFISGRRVPFSAFDPRRPEAWNRNKVLMYEDLVSHGIDNSPIREVALKVGVALWQQMRVLVCEGPSLLAWVGGFRVEPYGPRDRRVLGALVPAFRRRLLLERLFSTAGSIRAALDVALENLAVPAFLLTTAGAPMLANSAGRAALDADPRRLRAILTEGLRTPERCAAYRMVPVVSAGCPQLFLAIGRRSPDAPGRVQAAAHAWGLTPRQREVLALVSEGVSNARIAAELRISERTAETHVLAIQARAQVPSRAALVAAALRATR